MESDDLALVWKALADPSRRHILDLLRERPYTTGELADAFAFTRYAVMKHLKVLEEAELVIVRREGRQRWNKLNAVPIRQIYERWVSEYESHWASSLLQLKRFAGKPEGETATMNSQSPTLREILIEQEVTIQASPERLFDALVGEISEWWQAPYFHNEEAVGLKLEPVLNGRLYEDWGDGEGLLLATVAAIKRPSEVRLTGTMGMPGPVNGVILFELEEKEDATLLKLCHHAIGRHINEETRENYKMGWEALLGTNLRQHLEAQAKSKEPDA